ncbi:replication factor C large subunit [Natrinema thermotolerans]|uniref:Replication factor C large subunit n=1 Tax=Natrinema thermotolerans TaxID=121872 RepID=A0AAF0T0S1_9EURY|nr:replication factor C large subunit [Natrinema thermotolerans]QCC60298.1 replication factor C large subunit [Natrinema thermotolerans]QCC61207.1 replication factor C large subunit [Natrinema thermotolerans]WMT07320.1 replication factor C large subunit [Natrinema thermotolerans]
MTDWTEKYRPTTLSEVRGNNKARDQLAEWAETWDDHRESVIVHGSPGVGKTSAAHALANDMGWPVMELNASDSRGADVIEKIAGEASKSGTLTAGESGRRLVILDEADNFHGNADYGGSREVTRVVKDANQPIVLVANEFYEMSQSLRNACETIEFRDVSKRSIVPVLRDVCRREGIEFEEEALEKIAESTSGDLRSAVNDLQAVAEEAERLTVDDVVTSERDTTEGIFDFLDELIKEKDAEGALRASYDVDETPDDLLNWIEDNVPKDYAGAELADAYEFLSNADRWLGRVRATQDYSYWRYATDNMTAGVAASRRGDKGGWTRYGPPSYWSKLGRTKGTRNTRDSIAERIAEREGASVATVRREILPFLSAMTHHCKNRDLTVRMAAAYDLDESEVSFITGSGKDTNKVQSIVADAEERKAELAVEHSGDAFFEAERSSGDAPAEADADDGESQQPLAASDAEDESEQAGSEGGDDTATVDEPDDDQSGLSDFM